MAIFLTDCIRCHRFFASCKAPVVFSSLSRSHSRPELYFCLLPCHYFNTYFGLPFIIPVSFPHCIITIFSSIFFHHFSIRRHSFINVHSLQFTHYCFFVTISLSPVFCHIFFVLILSSLLRSLHFLVTLSSFSFRNSQHWFLLTMFFSQSHNRHFFVTNSQPVFFLAVSLSAVLLCYLSVSISQFPHFCWCFSVVVFSLHFQRTSLKSPNAHCRFFDSISCLPFLFAFSFSLHLRHGICSTIFHTLFVDILSLPFLFPISILNSSSPFLVTSYPR